MSRHRSPRPRYGRILLAAAALAITVFAVLGGMGVVPTAPSAAETGRSTAAASAPRAAESSTPIPGIADPQVLDVEASGPSQSTSESTSASSSPSSSPTGSPTSPSSSTEATADEGDALPADSGTGRRVVFSEAEQRVWLVRSNGSVRRTYLVSGSLEDNLDPGTYSVFSRSRWAVGVDDSGVMEFFVRFAHGHEAAIGFHSIPTKLGTPLQTRAQLGTPQSHGCIRQAKADAIALWKFAPEGSRVVVV